MKAVILAGGYGKRLRPLTNRIPKPMIRLAGKPIIEWQLEWLAENGADSFVILAGHLGEKLMKHVIGTQFRSKTEFSIEREPCGTAGAIRKARHLILPDKEFIVMNGDIISNMQISKMSLNKHLAAMALVPLKSTYGVVKLRGARVAGFEEKPLIHGYWLNAGGYLMSSKVIRMMPVNGNLESMVFPKLAERGLLKGVRYRKVYWQSIDSIKDMQEANKALENNAVYV